MIAAAGALALGGVMALIGLLIASRVVTLATLPRPHFEVVILQAGLDTLPRRYLWLSILAAAAFGAGLLVLGVYLVLVGIRLAGA